MTARTDEAAPATSFQPPPRTSPDVQHDRARGAALGSPWRRPPTWLIVLAASYLALPLLLFLATWLSAVTYPALLLLLGTMAFGLWSLTGRSAALRGGSCLVAALATGGIITVSGVLGGPATVKADWYKHAALTNALTDSDWPTQLSGGILRYYGGFYLVPAWVARQLETDPRLLLALWFALGLGIGLVLLAGALPWKLAAPALLLFLLMSGWDSVGCLVTDLDACLSNQHLEGWSRPASVNSVLTGMLWRSGQLLPALILVPLIMGLRSSSRSLWLLGPLLVASVYWAPFVALGLIPLLLPGVVTVARHRDWLALARDVLLPGLLVAPVALLLVLYLQAGSSDVPVEMLWSYETAKVSPWYLGLAAVIAFEVLPLVLLPALLLGLSGVHRVTLGFSCLVLLIVVGTYSDLTMNATLPFVVLFGWETAYLIARLTTARPARPSPEGTSRVSRRIMPAAAAGGCVIALLAAPTAVQEVMAVTTAPIDAWTCTARDDVCIPPDLRYQYEAPPEALPSWFFRKT